MTRGSKHNLRVLWVRVSLLDKYRKFGQCKSKTFSLYDTDAIAVQAKVGSWQVMSGLGLGG